MAKGEGPEEGTVEGQHSHEEGDVAVVQPPRLLYHGPRKRVPGRTTTRSTRTRERGGLVFFFFFLSKPVCTSQTPSLWSLR